MSSPLESRIRKIAGEEVTALLGVGYEAPPAAAGPDRVAELEEQLTALTARVDELEKVAAPSSATKRTPRGKTTSESAE